MEDTHILSIDIGTTNIKARYYHHQECLEVQSIPVSTFIDGRKQTQNASIILDHVQSLIFHGVQKYGIDHVVLSTAMHTLIYEYPDGGHSDMILWSDNRSEQTVEHLRSLDFDFYAHTGTPLHPMSPMTKLYADRDTPKKRVCDLKSFLVYCLTGNFVTDYSNASASGLYDLHNQTWHPEILEMCGLHESMLPGIVSIRTQLLLKKYPITLILGSTDGVMASAYFDQEGYRKVSPYVLSVGTSVGIRRLSDHIELSTHQNTFCYQYKRNRYLIGNASNNGGNLFDWLNHNYFKGNLEFDTLIDILEEDIIDASLLCKPYVFGERGPFWHTHETLAFNQEIEGKDPRIIAQALFYGMFANIELLLDSIAYDRNFPIFVTGGFFKNPRMAQIFANSLGIDLCLIDDENSVCDAGLQLLGVSIDLHDIHLIKHQGERKPIIGRIQKFIVSDSPRKED